MKTLLDQDPVTRTERNLHHSYGDKKFVVEKKQDVTEIVERNKAERRESDGHFNLDGQTKVASIPLVVYWDLYKRGIVQNEERFKRWLNDPDNRAFRTHPGSI